MCVISFYFSFLSAAFFSNDFSPFNLSQLFDFDFLLTEGIDVSLMLFFESLELGFDSKVLLLKEFLSGEVNFLVDFDFDLFSNFYPFSFVSLLLVLVLSLDLLLFIDLTLLSRLLEILES